MLIDELNDEVMKNHKQIIELDYIRLAASGKRWDASGNRWDACQVNQDRDQKIMVWAGMRPGTSWTMAGCILPAGRLVQITTYLIS